MMRILKHKIVIASLMLLVVSLAGAFMALAPILVYLRGQFEKSDIAHRLWPVIHSDVITDIFLNFEQALILFFISLVFIYLLYVIIRTFFSGGIYSFLVFGKDGDRGISSVRSFLSRAAALWPGFFKSALFGFFVYGICLFLGAVFGQVLHAFGPAIRIIFLLFFFLLGSTYLQLIRTQMVLTDTTSLRSAIKTTRLPIASSLIRLILGNLSVAIAGALIIFILWELLLAIRGSNWTALGAIFSIILQQAIVFVVCLMQAVRINFNHSILIRGNLDAVGRTELGGV